VDEVTDLAVVVKINAGGDLPVAPWETLELCKWETGRSQLATLGFDSTVTLGIISTSNVPATELAF